MKLMSDTGSKSHFSEDAQLQGMRLAYSELLKTSQIGSPRDAWAVLEDPLCELWMADYKKACGRPTFLELLDDRVASFLHDSAGYEGLAEVDRVVAAVSVSQERLTLEELFARLKAERAAGLSTERTLALIETSLVGLQEGLSARNLETLCQAAAGVIQWDLRPLTDLLDEWFVDYKAAKPRRQATLLRRALAVLTADSTTGKPVRSRKSSSEGEALQRLRGLASTSQARLTAAELRVVARALSALTSRPLQTLRKKVVSSLEDDTIAGFEHHILPLPFVRQPPPRYSKGSRHLRRGLGWKMDLGHFIPHSAGGPVDINLFLQDRYLNRGWSRQGRAYRLMERYLADHPGLFHFTRALYDEDTWIPRYLEMGILATREQAEELVHEVDWYEGFYLCCHPETEVRTSLVWCIGLFDNRPSIEDGPLA